MKHVEVTEVPAGAALLDVREDFEWEAGHAPTAQHLPASQLLDRLDEIPEADQIYVICRSGGRSAQVAQWMEMNGFEGINVTGGMGAWLEAGLPVVSENGEEPTVF